MNRAAIYARLSLAEESTSTERQKKDCRDHAKSLGPERRRSTSQARLMHL